MLWCLDSEVPTRTKVIVAGMRILRWLSGSLEIQENVKLQMICIKELLS